MPTVSRKRELREFLLARFPESDAFKRFAGDHFEEVVPRIKWTGNLEGQADDFIEALSARGLIAQLWPALRSDFEAYKDRIAELEGEWSADPRTSPGPTDGMNLALQLYRSQRGNTVSDALVLLTDVFSGSELQQRTDAKGFARFRHDGGTPATYWPEVVVRDGVAEQRAAFGNLRIADVPYDETIDLDSIKGDDWKPVGTRAATPPARSVIGPESMHLAPPVAAAEIRGDRRHVETHLPWGVPAAEIVVSRESYVLGFNPAWKLARWVAYRALHRPRPRVPTRWRPDPLIPTDEQTPSQAYLQNPYDRGQLVRRIEVPIDEEAFYLSIVAPQADVVNQRAWSRIEAISTNAAKTQDVWVIAGPVFLPARAGSSDIVRLRGHFLVPTHFFRIMVRKTPDGALDALAFLVPNEFTVREDVTLYLTSAASIEQVTGLSFFAASREPPPKTTVAPGIWG